jgi:dipeptide/tripeptide permease
LNVYLQALGFETSIAAFFVSLFFFGTYAFALVGGIVADTYLGSFRVLIVGSFCMLVGTLIIICNELLYRYVLDMHVPVAMAGLVLFYLGNGFLKPCLSAFLGDQFNEDQGRERSEWFSWFYMTIQIGSLFFSIVTPITLSVYPHQKYITFLVALCPMIIGLSIFVLPHLNYKKKPPAGAVFLTFLRIIGAGCCGKRSSSEEHWLDKAKYRFNKREVEDAKISLRVFLVLVPLPFFWMVFFQMYNLWVNQAADMDLTMGSVTIPASESSVLNGLLDLALIPIFSKGVYPFVDRFCRCCKFTLLARIAVGHIVTIAALCVAGYVTFQMKSTYLSVAWIVPQYILISCAEVLLSISAIEFSYAEAPTTMKGTVTAVFQCTTAIGNALITPLALLPYDLYLKDFVLAGIIFLVLIVFTIIAVNYQEREEPTTNSIQ